MQACMSLLWIQEAFFAACDPSKPGFWAQVALHVPGKTAQQCLDRHFGAEAASGAEASRSKKLPQYLQAPGAAPTFAGGRHMPLLTQNAFYLPEWWQVGWSA